MSERLHRLQGGSLPPRCRDLPQPPLRLNLRGVLPAGGSVAIVGTRRPSNEAQAFARELAGELAAAGVVILSGGARGIDTAAHRGALDVGGRTVVVAPSGYHRPYPRENAALFQEIVSHGGGYLSEPGGDAPASLPAFFRRNAIMVSLSTVVVVVEAGFRSGARNAAAVARRLGRPLFVVPSAPWNPRGLGCIIELQQGARPLLNHRDVLRVLEQQRAHTLRIPGAALRVQRALPGIDP